MNFFIKWHMFQSFAQEMLTWNLVNISINCVNYPSSFSFFYFK
jgi:hypothetical protein